MAGWSAAPFSTGGEVAVRDAAALKRMYADLIKEANDRRLDDTIEVLNPIAVRARLGSLPPGGDEETLFAIGRSNGEHLVLLLKQSRAGWRVCGLDR
jgi:hypothetical protein